MKRASIFLIIGMLALFSTLAYSHKPHARANGASYYHTSRADASSACWNYVSGHYLTCAHFSQDSNTPIPYFRSSDSSRGYWFYPPNSGDCSAYDPVRYDAGDGTCTTTSPPSTDQECKLKEKVFTDYDPASITGKTADYVLIDGCYYKNTTPSFFRECRIDLSFQAVNYFSCDINYQGVSSASNPPTSGNPINITLTDPKPSAPSSENTGGQEAKTETTMPLTTTQDSPSPGDSTSVQVDTITTTKSDQVTVDNFKESIRITAKEYGDYTVVTTTTTTTKADGTTIETITEDIQQNAGSTKYTNLDKKSGIATEQTIKSNQTSGQTVTTNITNVDGSTTTNYTTTGNTTNITSNPSSGENQQGNCFDGSDCKVVLDGVGMEDISVTNSRIESLKDEQQVKENELIASITDDEGNNYGVDNVTDFSAISFISKYFSFPSSTCSGGINTTIFGHSFVLEPCQKLQPLRDVLAWAFFILTAFAVLKIMLNNKVV